tara:strand:+ start:988 stop:1584 length:597 start_codon:yes stop_codon:yes gene_type:complete
MPNIEHDINKYDKYFITPDYNESATRNYYSNIEKILQSGVKLIQFRSKNLTSEKYCEISRKISTLCKKYKSYFIINGVDNLKFNKYCDGIQLTSDNIKNVNIKSIDRKYFLIGSCHNENEIIICNNSNIDLITISPIYNTGSKIGIGWDKFRELTKKSKQPVFALGGLNYKRDIDTIRKSGGIGLASKSYFYNLFKAR